MTAQYQIIYWRDIPAQIKVKAGRQRLARPLSDRFQVAIDQAAMRAGKTDSDAYLEEWRTSDWREQEGEPESLLDHLVAELESGYPHSRLDGLVKQGGWAMTGGSK